jgi:hypothetical protein
MAKGNIIISKDNFILVIGSKIRNMAKVCISTKMEIDIMVSFKII